MRISIFGMGYVGAVCGACLAEDGHEVIGVDVAQLKVDLINQGKSPVIEPGLEALIARQVEAGRLVATTETQLAVDLSEISMICVGTPSLKNGNLDLRYIETVARDIGLALMHKDHYHTVVTRSTVLPGTTRDVVVPNLEAFSGKSVGPDIGVAVNPEFLREGTAIADYREPPMTVIGEGDDRAGKKVASLYKDLLTPLMRRPIEVAEMIKYACNSWHATKITFANEIGNVAKALGVDGRQVMEVVCRDRKLNISDYYLKPGFAFGGSCLPKDVNALSYRARQLDVETPMISAIMPSNLGQIDRAMEIVSSFGERQVGLLGLSFKADTDDLRESPLVILAERLIGKGFELSIYDRNVDYARVNGANRDYITRAIPHISALLKPELSEVIDASKLMVLGNRDEQFATVLNDLPADKMAVDLAGFMTARSNGQTQGICW